MEQQLQHDHQSIESILDATSALAKKYFEQQHDLPPGRFIPSITPENVPQNGIGAEATLKLFEEKYSHQKIRRPRWGYHQW